jgi:DNA-binding CsgD family transcriptional regulator
MVVFSERMLPEVMDVFWGALARGETVTDAAKEVGTYREKGGRWIAAAGGIRPRRGRHLKGRCLTFAEREEIVLLRARGKSMRTIARRLGRSPSTVSRELRRNADRDGEYRPSQAHALAWQRASRPKPAKLAVNLKLRAIVEQRLARKYSPAQIAARADAVPLRPGDVGVGRDRLPIAVRHLPRHAQTRADEVSADGADAAQAGTANRAASQPDPRHGQHRRPPPGSR